MIIVFAVQFDTDIKDRAIILPEKEAQPAKRLTFDAIQLHTKGFKFNREEANE